MVWGISGSCALYRRKALDSIAYEKKEYFDESFFMYKEDLDIAERLNKKGWKAQFASKAIGYHQRTASKQSSRLYRPEYIKKNSYKNHLFILFKHARFLNLPVIAVYELLKFCFLLVTSPKTLTVVPEVIEQAPKMIKRRYV
jgi:GT2 family glycosyltransferase